MGFTGRLTLFLVSPLLYEKLNREKLIRVHLEVRVLDAQSLPRDIRLTAARLKESPLQITSRLSLRTGRRYIVVGEVSERS